MVIQNLHYNDPERILCAASQITQRGDGELYTFCGLRHSDCITLAQKVLKEKITVVCCGFLTSKGRFVDRREGYKIAFAQKQVEENDEQYLVSEDLY